MHTAQCRVHSRHSVSGTFYCLKIKCGLRFGRPDITLTAFFPHIIQTAWGTHMNAVERIKIEHLETDSSSSSDCNRPCDLANQLLISKRGNCATWPPKPLPLQHYVSVRPPKWLKPHCLVSTTPWSSIFQTFLIRITAAKLLQSCPTLCDPIDGSHQAPPSLGFSRQKHWNGLPFPSPMHQSEKWKWSRSVMSDS